MAEFRKIKGIFGRTFSRASVGFLLVSFVLSVWAGPGQIATDPFTEISVQKLIVMPSQNGHQDWIDAISAAKKSVHLEMYHLTDRTVIDALIAKAQDKSVDVRVILDGKSLNGGYKKAYEALVSGGVSVRGSSPAFSITHTKTLVVDGNTAFITTINLTNTARNTRDYGIVTDDFNIISEMEAVFEGDWTNSSNQGFFTPNLSDPHLAWSPNNSLGKLLQLIDSAENSIDAEVENLGSRDIAEAFKRAVARGVKVRMIVPECGFGDVFFNYPFLKDLAAGGVQTRVMPYGGSFTQPFLHGKLMVVDGRKIYLGSINYSFNSTTKARELGVIFADQTIGKDLDAEFITDWARSNDNAGQPSPNCSSKGSGESNQGPKGQMSPSPEV